MVGLEDSIKGTIFCVDEDGEYKELGIVEEPNIVVEDTWKYKDLITDTEAEVEMKLDNGYRTEKFIRQLRLLCKSDKDRKTERRFNKQSFRSFIKSKF